MLPLFPLGTVLFPGLVLPLHIFEERYRTLVTDLLAFPEGERHIGVVAIREGQEIGEHGAAALFDVGCTALLQQAQEHPDGRWDIVTVGARLFRLTAVDHDRPYLTGEVTWLPDELGDPSLARVLAPSVRAAFVAYVASLAQASGAEPGDLELPDDPLVLSHLVAASLRLDLPDVQDLLEQATGVQRLRRELSLLRREEAFLRVLQAAPATGLSRTPWSAN